MLRKIRRLFKSSKPNVHAGHSHGHHHHNDDNKEDSELAWQKVWAKEFASSATQALCLEYWQKHRFLDDLKSVTKIGPHSKVLDVGCGISSVLHFVEGERYGIDPLAEEYKKLYAYPQELNIVAAPGELIPFEDDEFDVVFNSNVLDHVTDPVQTLGEIRRVLKPDGFFVLTVELFPDGVDRDDPHHPHTLTKSILLEMVKKQFEVKYQNESPWIGLRGYMRGFREGHNTEIILVLQQY